MLTRDSRSRAGSPIRRKAGEPCSVVEQAKDRPVGASSAPGSRSSSGRQVGSGAKRAGADGLSSTFPRGASRLAKPAASRTKAQAEVQRGYLMRQKAIHGFRTGDMVWAVVPKGKKTGIHTGRVAVRASGSFNIQTLNAVVQGISFRHCRILMRGDGHAYETRNGVPTTKHAIPPRSEGRGFLEQLR